ncbi:MAG: endonuclease III domain-containing protein [Planctomycetota bacterium]
MTRTSDTLTAMYDAMVSRFGHQGWWPGDGAMEVCVGAILTQNTNWTNVEKAIANLKAANVLSVTALNALEAPAVAELIRPAGYYNRKAKRLKNFVHAVAADWGEDLPAFLDRSVSTLRDDLLAINGIGRETADSIILYAAGKPTFVVDAYTARIGARHQLFDPEADYEEIKETFESALPEQADLFNDYHAQLVAVGKHYCRPRNPKCRSCPLSGFPHEIEEPWDW